jgi:hypothetical protein
MGRRARDREEYDPVDKKATALDTSLAWLNWVDRVPFETRQEMADEVAKEDFNSYTGLTNLVQIITKHMLLGNIDIAVSKELREWANMLVMLQAQQNPTVMQQGTTESILLAQISRTTPALSSTLHQNMIIPAPPPMVRIEERK